MIQIRFLCSTQMLQNHSNTPAGPIYLRAATNLCPPQKCLPPELQQHNTPTFIFIFIFIIEPCIYDTQLVHLLVCNPQWPPTFNFDTNKCNQSKKACSDKGHVTFTTLNTPVNLADLTDLDWHLLQEQIYCPIADCTTGITLPAVLNRFDEDTPKI